MDKQEIKKIVQDELNKQLEAQIEKSLKNGKSRKEVVEIVKKSLENLYKYMWNKRTTWSHEIKGN